MGLRRDGHDAAFVTVERCPDDNREGMVMRCLLLAAMLGLGLLSGAASAAPVGQGVSAVEGTLLMPVQYRRDYAPPRAYAPPPRAYGRRYYVPPRHRYYRRYAPPPRRYAPPPRYYRR